jgi:hypothetical protein
LLKTFDARKLPASAPAMRGLERPASDRRGASAHGDATLALTPCHGSNRHRNHGQFSVAERIPMG